MAETWVKILFEGDAVLKADFAAKGDVLSASANDTPLILPVGANDTVLTAASGEASGLKWASAGGTPSAHKDSHDPNDGGDALDTANAAEISAVVAAGTGTSHSLARADHIHAISHGIYDNHIVTIDGSAGTGEFGKFTANGLLGRTPAEVLADLSGNATAQFDFTNQNLARVGTIALVGGQIAFPATAVPSADANTLDDYEEGSWAPSTGGNTTYTQQVGNYTKVGRLVAASFFIQILLIGTGSATRMSGFPFANITTANGTSGAVGRTSSVTTAFYMIGLTLKSANTYCEFAVQTALDGAMLFSSVFQNSTQIIGTVTYNT